MTDVFRPHRLPPNAWRAWIRHAPRAALRSTPVELLADFAAIAICGGASLLPIPYAHMLGIALCMPAAVPLFASLRARDTGTPVLKVLRTFFSSGWRAMLVLTAALVGAGLAIDVVLVLIHVPQVHQSAAAAASHSLSLSAPAAACLTGMRAISLGCLIPDLSFVVLLACDGLPAGRLYGLARRAMLINPLPMFPVVLIGIAVANLPSAAWVLGPFLVPLLNAVVYLAYDEIFRGGSPAKVCARAPTAIAPATTLARGHA
ncbi:MAG TPA: hypothetical protein VFQ88_07260 [Nevskiaceae bacterium]|nr:hypothetical protein [Nevskiaceae bacterium]